MANNLPSRNSQGSYDVLEKVWKCCVRDVKPRPAQATRDYWQDVGGSVWTQQSHQQPEVQGFQVFAWPKYSLSSASDKDIMSSAGFMFASAKSVLPCRYATSSSAACFSVTTAETHFLNIYEIQSYVRKWIVQQVRHVPGRVSALLIFIFWESTQNKVQHVFFSDSCHGNMTPCKWCVVRTRLKNKGVNADCTG